MDDPEFDAALIGAAFAQAAEVGWRGMRVTDAARAALLPFGRARARFPGPAAVLLRFGLLADKAALEPPATEPTGRERLFDMVMRRIDALQEHRAGVLAVLRALPFDPGLSLLVYGATLRSMQWLLDAAGVPTAGLKGTARTHGMMAVWLYVLRAWQADDSPDLSGTMAALDRALDRAMQAESWFGGEPGESTASPAGDTPLDGAGMAADPTMDAASGFAGSPYPAGPDIVVPADLPPPPPATDAPSSPAF